jgi:hypothetical protein
VLLFWILASYTLTRLPRGAVTLAVVATQVVAAAYLLGQAMLANAETPEEWWAWARTLQWGVALAPTLWYGLTILLLRDQKNRGVDRFLRWIGYPLGLLFATACVALTASIYVGDSLYVWSAPVRLVGDVSYFRFRAPPGPLYPGLVALIICTTVGAAVNAWLGWRWVPDVDRRRHFGWLGLSALLFLLGSGPTAVANWLTIGHWPTWLGHVLLATGQTLLVANVAAYSFFLQGKIVRTDFFYFLTAMSGLAVLYTVVFVVAGPGYSFPWLGFSAVILILIILSHASLDVVRRLLDRLFFASDIRRLRSDLVAVVHDAATTKDLGPLLDQAQINLQQISSEHDAQLVEEALRRMNDVAALARCRLISRLPHTLTDRVGHSDTTRSALSPLEQARALREILTSAIERLKPDGQPNDRGASVLQYNILNEEYVKGTPNKQIMRRLDLSEGTFHRQRRAGIRILTEDLAIRETRLVAPDARVANQSRLLPS